MQLNPRQLEAFRKVMLTGSMTLAAELLKISQPAVSRLIRDLEATVSVRLFRREGNRLIPGAEARRLFQEVDRFYRGVESVERVAQDLKSARIGTLRIASISALGLNFISEGIRQFSDTHPHVRVSLDVCPSQGVLELIGANQVDIGYIGFINAEYPGVDVYPQPDVAAVCVLPRDHPLARKRAVRVSDLQGAAMISLGADSPLRMRVEIALEAAGVTFNRSIETTYAHSACSMVAAGLGITIADPFTAANLRDRRIVCRPLVPAIAYTFSMVLPGHQPRSKVVNDFIRAMENLFRSELARTRWPLQESAKASL
ncbi:MULTISPECIES: LysR substrate-binding domain-containing protein [unclassified Achromobacter]|uniref:LysR substrate-binding domain-containing protein n=1 Tax=unclassified Achromobacter TaxID=2626865 RepID=UPI000B51CBF7|nr:MULTISPECIES: LysR substrate-binding domain-containing protein [unclassified Achromobacter]OWT71445.1 LysR family transcriptional regulator [Achromobacter sp. HZ34]OWT73102.1 LysR family transcriptional regulator [Achromobacter sp. HZ28]